VYLKGLMMRGCVFVWYLVGSADEVQVVAVQELADHISSKGEGDTTVVLPPALDVLVWVRPQQITQEAWREKYTILTTSYYPPNVVQRGVNCCIHTGR